MKRILFFTCEPGGAEVLIPVIQMLKSNSEFDVTVLGYGLAIDRFQKNGINYNLISPITKGDFSIFECYLPDMIVTSATSLPYKDMSEKYLWLNAKHKLVRTIAFIDQWQNYAVRFSGVSKNELLAYQPDLINCINDIGRNEMLELGFQDEKLLELGHPYLSLLPKKKVDKDNVLFQLNILNKDEEIVLFVSEAIEENYGSSRGYTQYEIIDYLMSQNFIKNKRVIVKLHPKDNLEKFKKYHNIMWIKNEVTSSEIIEISDYIVGMTSIMLIESFILNKKVISLQLNAVDDPLLLSRHRLINRIVNSQHQLGCNDFVRHGSLSCSFNAEKFIEVL